MTKSIRLTGMAISMLALPGTLQAAEEGSTSVFSVNFGLMFWTWILFGLTLLVLWRNAFPAIAKGLESRTASIEDAIAGAKGDREEARRLLDEHQRQLDEARLEAKGILQEGREAGERLREEILAQARAEHEAMLEKARKEMAREREDLVATVRRDAIDLSIAAAERLINEKLDDEGNRKLVRDYMTELG
ncbi:MAG: F0F1 ATP synthase subunit B [Gemmatimonadota bacterium]|nr:F0F1 ATP synthase subunit B [Gemmatimonadota bacterium]MDH3428021.1 F0F1 ATP synthase subunit B [Gemmatimonadota bacterium]